VVLFWDLMAVGECSDNVGVLVAPLLGLKTVTFPTSQLQSERLSLLERAFGKLHRLT
jgi:hypothetical protein